MIKKFLGLIFLLLGFFSVSLSTIFLVSFLKNNKINFISLCDDSFIDEKNDYNEKYFECLNQGTNLFQDLGYVTIILVLIFLMSGLFMFFKFYEIFLKKKI